MATPQPLNPQTRAEIQRALKICHVINCVSNPGINAMIKSNSKAAMTPAIAEIKTPRNERK
ncbi:hypothetical protein [Polycladidibacter stylochi]|uniref:hypothetical protein n=1 Tax=Polycladidibacter stylochi TaxID=1807766 RepID=UPI0012E34CA9|nr:hypothetical protein [Pseudovibrio stylochi]